jgi:hypothetical protein
VEQIQAAQQARVAADKAAHEAFVAKLAEITGLTAEEIGNLLPRPPGPRGPGPAGQKPPQQQSTEPAR